MRTSRRRSLLLLLATALPLAFADVEFTVPAPGAVMPVGELNVVWKESGRRPYILELSQYTLALVVGGNEANNSITLFTLVSGGNFTSTGYSASAVIPATITAQVPNGFYLSMTSTDVNGGFLVDYSHRFTLTGMTGYVASNILNGALALKGNNSPRRRTGNIPILTSSLPSSSSTTTSTTSSSPHTVTVTSAAKSSNSSSPIPTSATGERPLSMGVIAGIVIAVLIGASAIIALIIWTLLRRRRRKLHKGVIEVSDAQQPPAEWKQLSVTTLSELSADGRVMEMGDGIPPPEMDSTNVRAELEGDSVHSPLPPTREGSVGGGSLWESQTPLTPISPSVYEGTLQGPIDFLGSPVTPASRI